MTIPGGVASIGEGAFAACSRLASLDFQGNAPSADSTVFTQGSKAVAYYHPGTSGWKNTFAGIRAVMLYPPRAAGSLKVTITPAGAFPAGAQWYVDDGIPQPSGAIVLGLATGNHTVSFSTVSGWTTPASRTIVVKAGKTTAIQGAYVSDETPIVTLRSAAGNYAGLFYDTNGGGVTASNAGYFTAKVTAGGGFSASLQESAKTYSFSGQFSPYGLWQTDSIKGTPGLSASLQLSLNGGNEITGVIGNGLWTAEVTANRAIYSKTNPAPWAGQYTLIIPGSPDFADLPGGNGAAAVNVSASGAVTVSGTLGDGSTVTESAFVSGQGQWPLYASLYSKKGLVLGWLTFTNDIAETNDLEGVVAWIKPAGTGTKLYPDGFDWPYDAPSCNAFGSAFANQTPLMGWTNGLVVLQNGNLAQSLTNGFELGSNNQVTGDGSLKLTLATSGPKAGLFSGSVLNPATKKAVSFNGALLQNRNLGYGVFLGTNQGGSVVVGPQ